MTTRDLLLCLLLHVSQMAPAASHHLHPEQLSWLFAAATAASGSGAFAVSSAGFAAAVLDAGLVGSAAHVRRHPTIATPQRPPYSDYRWAGLGHFTESPAVLHKVAQQLHKEVFPQMPAAPSLPDAVQFAVVHNQTLVQKPDPACLCRLLNTSWQAVKPSLKELLRMLPKTQPALAPEVKSVSGMMQKLDDNVAACSSAAEAWQLYRRVLAFYSHWGSFPEGSSVASTPRLEGSSATGTPRTQAMPAADPQQWQQQQEDVHGVGSSSGAAGGG